MCELRKKKRFHAALVPVLFRFAAKTAGAGICVLVSAMILQTGAAMAATFTITVDGSDAIFLAGRTDVVIPPASDPWTGPGTHLIRHGGPTPEEIQETLPPFISVTAGDVVQVADPAIGGISFFNGFGAPFFGPGGNGVGGSNLTALDGISGYIGPQGPLVGVFLDNSIPSSGPPPAALDFTAGGLGLDFLSLAPELAQIFYIGDGITSSGDFQSFSAPTGATRMFLGIPDGFSFVGLPGAYDDNDGSYRIGIGINEPPPAVPIPAAIWLFGTALVGLVGFGKRKARAAV
jgi:hypothetical protein